MKNFSTSFLTLIAAQSSGGYFPDLVLIAHYAGNVRA